MNRQTQRILTTLTAITILALAITNATANNLRVSNQQIRVTWTGLGLSNNVIRGTFKCPVTLEGSFHSATIRKVAGALIGYISRAAVGNGEPPCTGGRATFNQETLPWHLTYASFGGTLPRITELTLNLIRASFIISTSEGNTCRATTTRENPGVDIATRDTTTGAITGLRADESRSIPLVNGPGGIFCGLGEGRFSGSGRVALLGTTNPISITLI
jgi:hypothetical protein